MKTQKLIVIAAIVCLLVGASGAAMARNDCPDGSIVGGARVEIVIDEFVNCTVVNVTVTRRVQVANADQFTMISSKVSGNVQVTNTVSAALINNEVFNGNLLATSNAYSSVVLNVVNDGDIRVNDNDGRQDAIVAVVQNQVADGNMWVNKNEKADVKENIVRNGDLKCFGNDRLDSFFNNTIGGTEDCRSSIGD